jgi:hypothetical protein
MASGAGIWPVQPRQSLRAACIARIVSTAAGCRTIWAATQHSPVPSTQGEPGSRYQILLDRPCSCHVHRAIHA